MKKVADGLIALIALEHIYFLVLEMFLWTTPHGMETFGLTAEFAQQSASLAANQGLYNGFLAAGIIWAAFTKQINVLKFFLLCVITAGVFGAVTAKLSILYVQGFPALLAFALITLSHRTEAE